MGIKFFAYKLLTYLSSIFFLKVKSTSLLVKALKQSSDYRLTGFVYEILKGRKRGKYVVEKYIFVEKLLQG